MAIERFLHHCLVLAKPNQLKTNLKLKTQSAIDT